MAYPVNKFHPDRHAPADGPPENQIHKGLKRELLEEIPRLRMRNRANPVVHFDIDPQNSKEQDVGPVSVRHETDSRFLQS